MIWYFTQKIVFQIVLLAVKMVNLDKRSINFKNANFPIPNEHVVGTKCKSLLHIFLQRNKNLLLFFS